MGYRGEELADLAPPLDRAVRRFGHRATGEVGDELRTRARRHTPVAKPGTPEIVASYGSSGAWMRARGGRRPGTLRDNFEAGPVETRRDAYRVPVLNDDPIFEFVEYDTQPHIIRARRARALTIPTVLGMSFRKEVHHPGTTGAHMMARALGDVAGSWDGIVRHEWESEARRVWTTRVGGL